ncbi:hypothetical protein NQZ68_022279 [Dissostichus eleginoides]|nr:hypothetical protein NQZ68_022279 [Dissostichus eleginoides]
MREAGERAEEERTYEVTEPGEWSLIHRLGGDSISPKTPGKLPLRLSPEPLLWISPDSSYSTDITSPRYQI